MTQEALFKSIQTYLRHQRDEMVQLTQRLCAIPTENPPGRQFREQADFLAQQMDDMGVPVRVLPVPEEYVQKYTPRESWDYPRFNVLARWDAGADQTLHFNSHFDVVPVSPNWKTDPFQPVVKRDRLYGRGTSDMKGCITSCIFALKALKQCSAAPPWNIEVSFTCDEEIGGHCGAGYLVKEGLVKPDAAVICEGGAGEIIMSGHRGVLWADVLIQGVSAHGSNPEVGVNAFEKGNMLVNRFLERHKKDRQRETRHSMDRESARRPSMTLGGVSGGGAKVNTIPDDFHFTIDRRLIPEESVKQVKSDFREIIQTAMQEDKNLKAKMNLLMGLDAAITDPDEMICKTARRAVRRVTGKEGKLSVFGAFTDMHFFVNHAKCPTIGYGVEGDGIHGCDEYLVVRSLADTARVFAEIALTVR
ncbi:MAG: M20 family metallopeptidase [Candidatus Omnitrophica bacterium]|nr:M20 family metallopeptidase [Candidatus Omnitrophota bacterium]